MVVAVVVIRLMVRERLLHRWSGCGGMKSTVHVGGVGGDGIGIGVIVLYIWECREE